MDYLISDLHLDHDNIIGYCDRPFDSVDAMNESLVENWNEVIDPDDEVLYGGDLTIRSSTGALLDWLDELHGEIVFLLGNHDGTVLEGLDRVRFVEEFRFQHRGVPFNAVHDPADGPSNPSGWVLHGHHHNNWPDKFPFITHDEQRVNFSVELLEYRPLAIDRLVDYLTLGKRFPDRAAAERAFEQDS
ncbi:metallophosphoesterase [Halosimplex pelagicum]|uniref:Metallophosphoesterase n=1 Tax=Halosimplex pelagicum TaxID=869886 RepID=A0A7D5PFV8_9EURY|nr:metallophosphoesterase [Halosimplex pelagicum]QLH83780.1 metallophosphoesterase [Halosimplex pelagicum]